MSAPLTIRWRDKVMDDPALSWRAKASAMPLVRHANLDGKNCYPGAQMCADEMSLGKRTIERGWAELKAAGYLDIKPLPASRRQSHGATKVLRFPTHRLSDGDRLSDAKPPSMGRSTFEGNREDSGRSQNDQENDVNADELARFKEANARPGPGQESEAEPQPSLTCAVEGCEREVDGPDQWCPRCKTAWIEAHPESPAAVEARRLRAEREARTLARFGHSFHEDNRGDREDDNESRRMRDRPV